ARSTGRRPIAGEKYSPWGPSTVVRRRTGVQRALHSGALVVEPWVLVVRPKVLIVRPVAFVVQPGVSVVRPKAFFLHTGALIGRSAPSRQGTAGRTSATESAAA